MRILYFIFDTVRNQYIAARSTYTSEFKDAVIHTTEKSVISGIKSRQTT